MSPPARKKTKPKSAMTDYDIVLTSSSEEDEEDDNIVLTPEDETEPDEQRPASHASSTVQEELKEMKDQIQRLDGHVSEATRSMEEIKKVTPFACGRHINIF